MAERLTGSVVRLVYSAPGGEFAVLRLSVPGRQEPVLAVGRLGEAMPGETLALEGSWEQHPAHGEQFRATAAVAEVPRTREGVVRYLVGLRGIGETLAERLVRAFGTQAIEVLESDVGRAARVKGVGRRRAEQAHKNALGRRHEREVMVFLQGHGISPAYAARIRKVYGDQAIARVRDNPYRLARDVPGIGFHSADRIARTLGIEPSSPRRIEAGVHEALEHFADEGHVYAPRPELIDRAAGLLEVDPAAVQPALDELVSTNAVVAEEQAIYLPRLHRAESATARQVAALLAAPRRPSPALRAGNLSEGQQRAVELATSAGVGVITGGPGTGKTTVVRALVATWKAAQRRVLLAAPTGRAAKRLQDAAAHPAQTVHRLLEWGRGRGGEPRSFGRGRDRPLECDLLVIDEASMLDIALARVLVEAVPLGATLLLVGDVDQLPSVAPGQVLGDLIASGAVPVGRLSEIFRQAEGSTIVENAYRILRGQMPLEPEAGAERQDFYFVPAEQPERARDLVVRMCRERIPHAFGLDPMREVQVLSPMHRGEAGTEGLNRALQAALNPDGAPIEAGTRGFRVGDKVMQVKNDYDRDVFNGDVGVVARMVTAETGSSVEVDFDGRPVRYPVEALDQLELAYAISVHKSQGSEYPAVLVPLLMQHYVLLERKLLYTAVTRGKRLVVLLGSRRAIRRAVEQAPSTGRHTGLAARLRPA